MPGLHETRIDDYIRLLEVFNQRGLEAVIVGGQAVNFWAEVFQAEEPEILQYRPFTSRDLDLHRLVPEAARMLATQALETEKEQNPFGKAFTIVSHTFRIETEAGRTLMIDSLKMVNGLTPREVKLGTVTAEYHKVIVRVLNPIVCFKSKIHNLRNLPQQDRQDEKHVRLLMPCCRAFVRRLLQEAQGSGNYRQVLNALEQVIKVTSSSATQLVAQSLGMALLQTVPLDEISDNKHPKIVHFTTKRLPEWRRRLRK